MFGKITITPADRWFSLFIRFRDDWTCINCHRYCMRRKLNNPDLPMLKIECAHVYSRRHKSVRHDSDNAFALCFKCHGFYTGENNEWLDFCTTLLGAERMNRLTLKKNFVTRHYERTDERLVADDFRAKVKEIAKKENKEWIIK
jgi:hypothetical protein